MIAGAWDWIRSHVWLSIGIVVGVIVLWRLSSGSASADAPPGVDPTAVQYGSQLQALQMGYAAQAAQTEAQLAAVRDTNAAQITIADMAKQLQLFETGTAADVAHHQIDVADHANTLEASIAIEQLRSQENIARIQADTLLAVQQSNAAVSQALIASNAEIQSDAIAAQKSIAKQSLFSKIF